MISPLAEETSLDSIRVFGRGVQSSDKSFISGSITGIPSTHLAKYAAEMTLWAYAMAASGGSLSSPFGEVS